MKENEMIHTSRVLIVEGKYDAARLSHLTDAMILLTDGFGIYSDKKRQQLFKALAQKNGLILLTDSDAAGFRIRNYITNLVGEKNVVQRQPKAASLRRNVLKCESNARHLFGGSAFWATPSTKQKECADEMRILRPSALRRRVWCRLQQQGGSKTQPRSH